MTQQPTTNVGFLNHHHIVSAIADGQGRGRPAPLGCSSRVPGKEGGVSTAAK